MTDGHRGAVADNRSSGVRRTNRERSHVRRHWNPDRTVVGAVTAVVGVRVLGSTSMGAASAIASSCSNRPSEMRRRPAAKPRSRLVSRRCASGAASSKKSQTARDGEGRGACTHARGGATQADRARAREQAFQTARCTSRRSRGAQRGARSRGRRAPADRRNDGRGGEAPPAPALGGADPARVARQVRQEEEEARIEAKRRARTWSRMRCSVAASHAAETTVSVVELPSDDMKGRIIGKEGRNIRALESLTGVEIIIDDTPQAVVLSSFDGARREVARITLAKLIEDGMHPPGSDRGDVLPVQVRARGAHRGGGRAGGLRGELRRARTRI